MQSNRVIDVDEKPQTAITIVRPTIEWIVPGVDGTEAQAIAWQRAMDAWLDNKRRHSGSDNTVMAYRRDWFDFFTWIEKAPWLVSSMDADAWLQDLQSRDLKHTTINRKLAALSSFYTYVSEKFTYIGRDQVERSIYTDANGNPRMNPFRKPERLPVETYGHSRPISPETVRDALAKIKTSTLTGARDYALIMTYLFTGRRSSEIGNLRWGDITETGPRHYYDWRGKGGKQRRDELPPPAWHAITAFLKTVGRLETIKPADYIFRPVFGERAARLPNVSSTDPNRPISSSMINRIIKRRFVAVGVKPEDVHTHTMRHTAAHLRYRDGAGQDILEISKFLNHSSINVTQIYLAKQHQPIDTGWSQVEQLLLY
jgi:integrase